MSTIPMAIQQKMEANILEIIGLINVHANSTIQNSLPRNRLLTPQELVSIVKYIEEIEVFLKSNESQAILLNNLGLPRSHELLLGILNDFKGAKEIYSKMFQDQMGFKSKIINIQRQTQEECSDILNKTIENRQKASNNSFLKWLNK